MTFLSAMGFWEILEDFAVVEMGRAGGRRWGGGPGDLGSGIARDVSCAILRTGGLTCGRTSTGRVAEGCSG